MTISATKTVPIARSADESYDFIANPATMPQWAIHNVTAIRPLGDGRWEMDTPRGKGTLIPHYEKGMRILDHEFIDAGEGRWQVTGRVVPVSAGESVYIMTLPKPESLPAEAFEAGMQMMDEELAALKACIESRPAPSVRLSVIETLYEAFSRRDIAKITSLVSPELVIEQSEELPWGGTYRGLSGLQVFFGKLLSNITPKLTIERMIDAGDHVAVVGWTEGTATASGTSFRVPIVHIWGFKDDVIDSFRIYIHHPAMFQALNQK